MLLVIAVYNWPLKCLQCVLMKILYVCDNLVVIWAWRVNASLLLLTIDD